MDNNVKMKIVEKPLEEVIPYDKNPRRNEAAVQNVANSIRQFGFKNPIIVDKDGVIVAGHTRYLAAQQLGLKTVPVIVASDLTPKQVKAYRIADNKTSEKASWDEGLLKEELKDVLGDFDMTEFGFGDFELTILTEDLEPEPYDKSLIEEYSGNETNYLIKKRVIITYKEDQEEELKSLLGIESVQKVVYDISELT